MLKAISHMPAITTHVWHRTLLRAACTAGPCLGPSHVPAGGLLSACFYALCRFLRGIIVSSFREEAKAQSSVVGMHNDLAVLFKEFTQNLAGAPSNALLVGLFREAAPRRLRTNVWARLRGQKEQLTIQVQHAAASLCMSSPSVTRSTDAVLTYAAVASAANVFGSACIQPLISFCAWSLHNRWRVMTSHMILFSGLSLHLIFVSCCSFAFICLVSWSWSVKCACLLYFWTFTRTRTSVWHAPGIKRFHFDLLFPTVWFLVFDFPII